MRREACQANGTNGHLTPSSKRLKFAEKLLEDSHGVNHACVPRKLRSAMKKRNRRSVAPASRKLQHEKTGVQSTQKDDKLQVGLGPITKDEAEVVETLYALSRMVPEEESPDTNKPHVSLLEANASSPAENPNHKPVLEDLNSASERVKTGDSSGEPRVKEQAPFGDSQQIRTQGFTSEIDCNVGPHSFAVGEETNKKSLPCLVSLNVLPEPSKESRLRQFSAKEAETNSEFAFRVSAVETQSTQHTLEECKKNGLALWPGWCSTAPQHARNHVLSGSMAVRTPAWMGSPHTNASKVDRVSMKRCAKHVYITRLIRALKMSDKEGGLDPLCNQPRIHAAVNYMARQRDQILRVLDTTKDPFKVRNGIIDEEKSRAAFSHGVHPSLRQCLDFTSVPDRAVRTEVNAAKNGWVPPSQLQLPYLHSQPQPYVHSQPQPYLHSQPQPYLHSQPQYHHIKSLSMSQTSLTPTAVQQAQTPQPLYRSSHFPGSHQTSHVAVNRPQFWMSRMSSQQRPSGSSLPSGQILSWKHGKADISSPPITFPQYKSLMPQHNSQQCIVAGSPLSMHGSTAKRQHNLPLALHPEENGATFYTGGALALQLLCNEHI